MSHPAIVGEREMLDPLLKWLAATGRVRDDTTVRFEFPWRGRRVDVATLTRSGSLSAYELKYGGFSRVLEQAIYNRMSFDRSWIVIRERPRASNLDDARAHGVGVLQVNGGVHVLVHASPLRRNVRVRSRLRDTFRRTGGIKGV